MFTIPPEPAASQARPRSARSRKPNTAPTQKIDRSRQKEDEARKTLAFASLVERAPKGKPIVLRKPMDAPSQKFWQEVDGDLVAGNKERAKFLKALHEKTSRFFTSSTGAGPGRSIRPSVDEILMDQVVVYDLQQGAAADFPLSPGESLVRLQPDDDLRFVHRQGLLYFLYPPGFGYMKDRTHVAGFKSHGFRLDPKFQGEKRWRIEHVQLVGILTQEQPVVYLTDKMPSMEQVRQGKTRGLDFFEEVALPALAGGEDMYIVQKNDTIRMLGALRVTRTCQNCHDAEIGDLLGAFSYTLRPAPTGP